ncbi:unnamed protein product [Calypogeia fissa]
MESTSQPPLERARAVKALNARPQRRFEVLANHLKAQTPLERAACSVSLVGQPLGAKANGAPVVVGGMVLDIQACPATHEIRPGTTTPGQVRYVRGGVGRNVAECLAKLGQHPFLISVVGDDMAGDSLIAHWRSLGLSVDGIRKCVGISTPVVSAVFDTGGELAAAVADTQAVEVYLTPDWIERFTTQIQAAPVVMLDANLHPLAIKVACKLASDAGVPVWFEPVSIAKATRATGLLKSITFVSPNEAEIVAMAEALQPKKKKAGYLAQVRLEEGTSMRSVSDILGQELQGPIREVLRAGVKYIVLTLGSQGAVLCSREPLGQILFHHYSALPASVVKLSGAGDCLVAGTLAALSKNLVEPRAVAYGLAAAKLAVESEMNVPERLSWEQLSDSVRDVLDQVRTLVVFS